MSMKLKIGFTVEAETLFGLMAKFLPIEDLHIEELGDRPAKVARLAHARAPGGSGGKLNLKGGVNAVIMAALADGQPRRYSELKAKVNAAGYAATGIGSKLGRLKELGVAENVSPGLWRLAEAQKKSA
jgi:hypothetical protein